MNQVHEPTPQKINESGNFPKLTMTPGSNSNELPCPPCRLEKLRKEKLRRERRRLQSQVE